MPALGVRYRGMYKDADRRYKSAGSCFKVAQSWLRSAQAFRYGVGGLGVGTMGAGLELRIGLMLDASPMPGADFASLARECEDFGFDLATLHPDHPSSSGVRGAAASLEAWTAATWVLAATRRLTVLPDVLGLPYRHPGVVAKMAESLDRLSGGRVVVGLGSGGDDKAVAAFGLTVRSPGQKASALEEAVSVIRQLWRPERMPTTFRGTHFALDGASINPAPARAIPIWLGVHARKGWELVARVADGWLPSSPALPPQEATAGLRAIQVMAEDHGRPPGTIEYAYNVTVFVGNPALAQTQGPAPTFAGSPGHIADQLAGLARSGFTVLNLWPTPRTAEQPRLLAEKVVPLLRS